jgi:hypothetical protein
MRRCLYGILSLAFVALLSATPAGAAVIINEIMYDSNYSPDIEYIELYNTGPTAQNLVDWYLLDNSNAHPHCNLVGTLGVGKYLVIAADTALFHANPLYHGLAINPNGFDPGGLGFGLGNSSDQVRLFDDDGHMRDSVQYQTSGDWPADAAGHGPSCELVNPFLDNTIGTNWLASVGTGGTPGVVNSRYAANAAPVCDNGKRNVALPKSTDAVTVTVRALDPENHLTGVTLSVDLGLGFVPQTMYDDGAHGDGAAGDSVFGAVIPAQTMGKLVKYYATATDILGQFNTWPDGAPTEYRAYTVGYVPPVLVVNEIVADNTNGVFDDHSEREDWVEIYNPGAATVDLAGMYLTDNLGNENKWQIPAGISIVAGGHLVFWADDDSLQGPMHAGFKLSASGEEIGIFSARDLGNTRLDGWKFGPVAANVAVGYRPDCPGTSPAGVIYAPEYLATPTPAASNATSAYYSRVCINEFQTTSLGGGVDDWIELYNRGTSTYDLSGCFLSDNRSSNLKYKFPAGTALAAGNFLVVNETTLGFSMSSSGELIVLTAADSTSGLDFYDFKQEAPDTSEGRAPDGTGCWVRFPTPTPGTSNIGALAVPPGFPNGSGVLSGVRAVPNPFGASTEIRFVLGQREVVTAAVYDPAGRRVRVLHSGTLEPGSHALGWNGSQESGARAGAGLYFVRVSTATATKTCSMVLLK